MSATIRRTASLAALLAAAAAVLLPLVWILTTSFKTTADINAFPPALLPRDFTTANYSGITDQLAFGRLLVNTVIFAGGVTVLALAFDSMAAYALARIDFRGRSLVLVAILATLMVPFQATLVPVYRLVNELGLVNTFPGMILPRAADAFGIFLLRQFFLSIPRDLDSAARVDGAGEFRIFRSIVLPNAKPALLTLALFVFMNNWNDLLWPLVFTTDDDMRTLTAGLALLTGKFGVVDHGLVMAGSVISMAPLIVLFLLVQRRFIEGISTTGIK